MDSALDQAIEFLTTPSTTPPASDAVVQALLQAEQHADHVLHLALGALCWRESPEAAERVAPLLLLPVAIELDAQRRGRLAAAGEQEPLANRCLDA